METTEEKVEEIHSILIVMKETNEELPVMHALDILMKLVHNILKSPQEEKFRKIKKTNKTIATKLLGVDGMHDLLLALGFDDESSENYSFDIHKYTKLAKYKRAVEDFHDEIRKKYMTPEELQKFELLQEQKKQMVEEYKKNKKIKEELEKGMKCDRAEKSTEETKTSKGNQLNFGANVVKFQPPAPSRGR